MKVTKGEELFFTRGNNGNRNSTTSSDSASNRIDRPGISRRCAIRLRDKRVTPIATADDVLLYGPDAVEIVHTGIAELDARRKGVANVNG